MKQDGIEAYKWSLLASEQGHDGAKRLIDLMQSLTIEQKAEGKRRAQSFKVKAAK